MQASAPQQVTGGVRDVLPEYICVLKLVALLIAGNAVLQIRVPEMRDVAACHGSVPIRRVYSASDRP
jgi:hypothetical protein